MPRDEPELSEVQVIYQTRTDRAVCIREDEDGDDIWLPKSLCTLSPSRPERGDTVTLEAPDWLLTREGLV